MHFNRMPGALSLLGFQNDGKENAMNIRVLYETFVMLPIIITDQFKVGLSFPNLIEHAY